MKQETINAKADNTLFEGIDVRPSAWRIIENTIVILRNGVKQSIVGTTNPHNPIASNVVIDAEYVVAPVVALVDVISGNWATSAIAGKHKVAIPTTAQDVNNRLMC